MKYPRQIDKVIRQCVSAYLSGKPILYLQTDDMDLVNQIIADQSMVELRTWRGETNHKFEPIPDDEIPMYLRESNDMVSKEIETEEDGSLKKKVVKFKKNVKIFNAGEVIDPMGYLTNYGQKIPVIMAVKNYNLAAIAVGSEGSFVKTEANLQRYINQYINAPKGSTIRRSILILAASTLLIPQGLEDFFTVINPDPLCVWEIKEIVEQFAKEKGEVLEPNYRDELVDRLKGFGARQIEELLNKTVYEAGYLTNNRYTVGRMEEDLPENVAFSIINNEKRQMLSKEGVLEYERVEQDLNIGGMDQLMKYLEEKCHFVLRHRIEFKTRKNVDFPKGILVCGVPGSGKSMMAKKISKTMNIPLVRMDMGSITKSHLGESAEQMRKAFRMAEAMAPCVLWIDEIEKAFSGIGNKGSGDSASAEVMRCFAMFLTWMQEQGERTRKNEDPPAPCFIFATANNIQSLPPEFLRSGRFDRKYYVFMPTEKECIDIFKADLENINSVVDEYGNSVKLFDTASLDRQFWKSVMDYCVEGGKGKFLTGSDIHGINQETLRKLLLAEYGGALADYEENDAAGCYEILEQNFKRKKIVQKIYNKEEYGRMLRQAIDEARTYGETNLKDIAECYIGLHANNFSPVSNKKNVLIPFEAYDVEREQPVDTGEVMVRRLHGGSRYDSRMYQVIGDKINQIADILRKQ